MISFKIFTAVEPIAVNVLLHKISAQKPRFCPVRKDLKDVMPL